MFLIQGGVRKRSGRHLLRCAITTHKYDKNINLANIDGIEPNNCIFVKFLKHGMRELTTDEPVQVVLQMNHIALSTFEPGALALVHESESNTILANCAERNK